MAGEFEVDGALVSTTDGLAIANEAMLDGMLDRAYIIDDEVFVRMRNGTMKPVGPVVSAERILFRGRELQMPGEIYRLRSGAMNVRSVDIFDNDFKVFQHRETGQMVLKLPGYTRPGWAYCLIGVNEYGWVSLSNLILVSEKKVSQPVYHKCKACNGTGHAIQNLKCSLCHGTGHINCLYCRGNKILPCLPCRGTGQTDCGQCLGKGSTQCSRCFGHGFSTDATGNKITCDYCNGNGKFICYDCNGTGKRTCMDCNGQGTNICNQCFGAGFAICYQCFDEGSFRADIMCKKCLGSGWVLSSKIKP